MGTDMAVALTRQVLMEALLLCAPMLITACVVSLVMSLLQTITGIQEQTLSTVPRLVIVFAMTFVLLPWTAHRTVIYTRTLWTDLHRYLG
ncbi:flagellar biosynthetic protein FliQ [Granulicella cerasi]|uniref:Flagellar biosynthetic protein FliQ n=1 Tax=Granulicella cerasi TaxID=741063 RepID=A0ABW1Z4E4_9BACT|nr:flagellar biosynthetic protein FliQ [Granulicella cerasi]